MQSAFSCEAFKHLIDKAWLYLAAPFQSWDDFLYALCGPLVALYDLHSKVAWLYLLSTVVLAWVIYLYEKQKGVVPSTTSFVTFICPREVRGGPGNSDSVISGSLASPKPPAGGETEE